MQGKEVDSSLFSFLTQHLENKARQQALSLFLRILQRCDCPGSIWALVATPPPHRKGPNSLPDVLKLGEEGHSRSSNLAFTEVSQDPGSLLAANSTAMVVIINNLHQKEEQFGNSVSKAMVDCLEWQICAAQQTEGHLPFTA